MLVACSDEPAAGLEIEFDPMMQPWIALSACLHVFFFLNWGSWLGRKEFNTHSGPSFLLLFSFFPLSFTAVITYPNIARVPKDYCCLPFILTFQTYLFYFMCMVILPAHA